LADQKKDRETYSGTGDLFQLPSGEEISNKILKMTGEYTPEGVYGRAGMAGIEGLTSTFSPTGKRGMVEKAVEIAKEAVPSGIGSTVGSITGEISQNPVVGFLGGLLGQTGSAVIPKAVKMHVLPTDAAERVSGKAIRESATDSASARNALELAKLQQSGSGVYPAGFKPELGQITEDAGIRALERRLETDSNLAPASSESARLAREAELQRQANKDIVSKGVGDVASRIEPNMEMVYDLQGSSPRQAASSSARKIFSDLEESADTEVNKLWKDPQLSRASMYKNKVVGSIRDYLDGLTKVRQESIPSSITELMSKIDEIPSRDVPLAEIQDLRSRVLAEGRKAFRSGDNFVGGELNQLGKHLGDLINDSGNIVFGDRSLGLTGGLSSIGPAREAWQKAVDATRDYHQKYNTGFLKDLNRDVAAGVPKVSLDSTLDAALSGRNATQNLEQMQRATNGAINDHVSDYMIAGLTKDGNRIVKPLDVDNWLGKGNNSAVVDMIPGLRDRITNIRGASVSQQISENLKRIGDSPERVVKFFDDNRADIVRSVKPVDRAYFNMIENAARRMQDIPIGKSANLNVINKLANGRVSDILYGVGTGRITKGLIAYGAGNIIQHAAGVNLGWIGDAATAMAGAVGNVHAGPIDLDGVVDKLLSGKVRGRAIELLQQARTDPVLAARLMDKPTPETLRDLFGINTIRAPAIGAAQGSQYGQEVEELESRQERATGGAVLDHESESDHLVNEVERVRKSIGSETQAHLDKPDDMVVAALKVANEAM